MSTFLADKGQMTEDDVIKIASDCLQQKVKAVSKIGRGANSKVYHVICSSTEYVVKFYFQHPSDSRDRLGVEFKSLSFLRHQGLRMVPSLLLKAGNINVLFMNLLKEHLLSEDISQKDIDNAVDFLERLKNLSIQARGFDFSAASEAFFCARDIASV